MLKQIADNQIRQSIAEDRSKGGFTLVEMMLSLIILVMMTGIVAMGIPVAQETYTKAVTASNAQALLSTTTTELRNELGLAQDVQIDSDNHLYYRSGAGYWASITKPASESGGQGLVKTVYFDDGTGNPDTRPATSKSQSLVSSQAATDSLYITFSDITYSPGAFTIKDLKVYQAGTDNVLASAGTDGKYTVRALMVDET